MWLFSNRVYKRMDFIIYIGSLFPSIEEKQLALVQINRKGRIRGMTMIRGDYED